MKNIEELHLEASNLAKDIFIKKLEDYGPSWKVFREKSIVDQIFIKIKRIRQIEISKENKVGDDIKFEYLAILNYVIIYDLINVFSEEENISYSEISDYYDEKVKYFYRILSNKNADYGEAWRDMFVESYTDFMYVKILRVKELLKDGKTLISNSEGVDSNLVDVFNYSIFAIVKLYLL